MSDRPPHTESELVEFVRSIDVRAPESLHRQVDSLIDARSNARRRPISRRSFGAARILAAGAFAAAVVAVVAIVVAASPGGSTSSTLSLQRASTLTLSTATAPAPGESRSDASQLAAAVDGVGFPYRESRLGWRSTGSRTDHVGARLVTTVFYADGRGRRVGYAIVAGSPAPRTSGGVIAWRGGVAYRKLIENGVQVVAWLRDGHLCVVSGRGVSSATLLALASWEGRGSAAS